MSNYIHHTADSRGHFDHGWLKTYHTFSFADYYDRSRMNFGVLRVINDDIVEAGMGFGTHPHDNMEIITIPISGSLEHKDSMGNGEVIHAGEVQVMSAGTGIQHSEFNPDVEVNVNLLQIWVYPNKRNVIPRYAQMRFNPEERINRFQRILAPGPAEEGLWIYQDAWFFIGDFDKEFETSYIVHKAGNGIYVFIISGNVIIDGIELGARDGLGISNTKSINILTISKAEILIMEVPMETSK